MVRRKEGATVARKLMVRIDGSTGDRTTGQPEPGKVFGSTRGTSHNEKRYKLPDRYSSSASNMAANLRKTYAERAAAHSNLCARAFLELMERKRSNLSVAVDVTSKQELLEIADKAGPYICLLKVRKERLNQLKWINYCISLFFFPLSWEDGDFYIH